jgi:glutamate-ammonia-ligase adenylyltransferase
MPELAQLERELLVSHPERWVRHHLATFPTAYFRHFDSSQVSRHLGAMRRVSDQRPVYVRAVPEEEGVWNIEVVGYDAFQFLSTFCMLLAVRRLAILEGWVYTSQVPPEPVSLVRRRGTGPRRPLRAGAVIEPDRRSRIVDAFRVRPLRAHESSPDWDALQSELIDLTRMLRADKYEEVYHRLVRPFAAALGPFQPDLHRLEPIDLTLDVEGSETTTGVRIRAADSFGFLSLTASALALCGIRIVQSEIRTTDELVDDRLWVTDRWGHKITDEATLHELWRTLILIEHFSSRLPRATDPEAALVHFSRFAAETMARPNWATEFQALERPEVLDALVRVLGESHFLWEDYLHAQPEIILPMICDPTEWARHPGRRQLTSSLSAAMDGADSPEGRVRAIRQFRDREVFRADLRSILGLARGQEEFSAELTAVAEVMLEAAYALALEETAGNHGPAAQGLIRPSALFALGKFGGKELGFASDLELMIIYDDRQDSGDELGARSAGFYDSVVGALREVLSCREGHAFDVDLRLRPYGRAGSPATSMSTFLDYYHACGPAWGYERQALIKLRKIAGDRTLGREVLDRRDRFVYGPEPFDLDCLWRMRRLQCEQHVAPGTISAKYSPGALVDVEYFVQALQIVHGSSDRSLRSPNTLEALAAIGAAGWLDAASVSTLRGSYQFFRRLIDALRVVRDHSEDLTVPRFDTDEFLLLSRRMKAAGPEVLRSELEHWLTETRSLTSQLECFLAKPHEVVLPSSASF